MVLGRGGGQVVFHSNDLSSNPAEVYIFSVEIVVQKNKK